LQRIFSILPITQQQPQGPLQDKAKLPTQHHRNWNKNSPGRKEVTSHQSKFKDKEILSKRQPSELVHLAAQYRSSGPKRIKAQLLKALNQIERMETNRR